MKNLIIDIGNSAIKVCTGNSFSLSVQDVLRNPYSGNEFEKAAKLVLTNYIKGKSFSRIGISVLNNDKKEFLKDFFSKVTKTKPEFINRDFDLPFKIRYKEGLGNDRICSIAGALGIFNKSSILVIDFGTATTFTLMVNKILTSGVISPGINTSLKSLIQNTDLPNISMKFPAKILIIIPLIISGQAFSISPCSQQKHLLRKHAVIIRAYSLQLQEVFLISL
ncbi:MAG: type III pantothenate kinase [Ignavibacteria bacterium]